MKIYSNSEIKSKLNLALDKLYVKDWYLLRNSVHERSITHKLGEYLQEFFPEYDVDCEYDYDIENKDGGFKKQIYGFFSTQIKDIKNKLKDLGQGYVPENEIQEYLKEITKNFYPDIIIHKRGTNKHNLLVIEAKKNSGDSTFDQEKLIALCEEKGRNHYKYQLGVSLILSNGENFAREDVKQKFFPKNEKKK